MRTSGLPLSFALLACALLFAAPLLAAASVPGFELIYTAPVETQLARPGLRSPLAAWPEFFAGARRTLDIEQFYVSWKSGEPLDPILLALERAGARGVRVRFLVDDHMAEKDPPSLVRLSRVPNLTLRRYPFSRLRGRGIVHAKYMVADGQLAYLGSHNFDWRSLKHTQELGLLIREAAVAARVQAVFEEDWRLAGELLAGRAPAPIPGRPEPAALSERAYLVASPGAYNPPGVGDSEAERVRLLGTARAELCVQLLDYAPLDHKRRFYAPIDNALRSAAARGVQIKLLVSHWNTSAPAISHLKSLSLVPGIAVRIVTLPEAKEGFIPYARVVHAKYMTVDGEVLWLGTSNWSGGYLDDSRNLEVVVKDERLAAEARALHEQLWTSPYAEPVVLDKAYPPPRRH